MMTIQLRNPAAIAPPFSRYSHGVSVPAGASWLYVSGQVGSRPTASFRTTQRGRWI